MDDGFKPINTQEEFNSRIKERLERESRKYKDYTSPDDLQEMNRKHQEEIDALNSTLKEKEEENVKTMSQMKDYQDQIARYESDSVKMKVASEAGLSSALAQRLQGTTEEELREDAQKLLKLTQPIAPLASDEVSQMPYSSEEMKDAKVKEAMQNMLKNL